MKADSAQQVGVEERLKELSITTLEMVGRPKAGKVETALGMVARLVQFVVITTAEYEQADTLYRTNRFKFDASMRSGPPGERPLTNEEQQLVAEGADLNALLHLRIETFYVFAKILLDRLAVAVNAVLEAVHGPGRAASLASRSKLRTNLELFAEQKGLSAVPRSLLTRMDDLEHRIVEYRDWFITHEDSPRAFRGTLYRHDDSGPGARIHAGRIDASTDERQGRTSETPHTLLPDVLAYVDELFDYVEANVPSAGQPVSSA